MVKCYIYNKAGKDPEMSQIFVPFTLDVFAVPAAYFVHPNRDAKLEKPEICSGYKNPQKFILCLYLTDLSF